MYEFENLWPESKHKPVSRPSDPLPAETSEDLRSVMTQMREVFQPRNVVEKILVERLTYCWWRSRTTFRAEAELVRDQKEPNHVVHLHLLNLDQEFDRTIEVLLRLQKDPAFPPGQKAKPHGAKSKVRAGRVVPIRPAA